MKQMVLIERHDLALMERGQAIQLETKNGAILVSLERKPLARSGSGRKLTCRRPGCRKSGPYTKKEFAAHLQTDHKVKLGSPAHRKAS